MDDPRNVFDEMERVLDLTLTHKAFQKASSGFWKPATDIYETRDYIFVLVEIPGMKKSEINVTYSECWLQVSGIRKELTPKNITGIQRMELDSGPFIRKIKINIPVIPEKIEAVYRNGILKIMLIKE